MRVLLAGGAGFVGSHVAERLLERGHRVAVLDDLSTGKRENVPEGAVFYEGDIRSGCGEAFEAFRPEVLCHQAAQTDVRRSVREPDFDAGVNTVGTIKLLQNCVRYGVGKVVFASTGGAIYGEQREFPATEGHPRRPLSPYGISKLAAECYLDFYQAQYGLPRVVLRYANVYGPKQDPHGEAGVVAIFCGDLAAGRSPTINGTGEQTRDYVYVGDVARANVLAVEEAVPPGAYNIGTAVETSVLELFEKLCLIAGTRPRPNYLPAKPGEQLRSSISFALAEDTMGWRPEMGLAAGLEETLRSAGVRPRGRVSAYEPAPIPVNASRQP
jgi:UDP-glucose 4-epimerase